MTVQDLLKRMSNGATHITLIDNETGVIILKTIWYNSIPEECLKMSVLHIAIKDYEMILTVS